jgi:hypothetical protein
MTQQDKPTPETEQGGYGSPAPEDEVAGDQVPPQHEDGGEAEEVDGEYGSYEAASLPKEGEEV